jgi:hypothetical protein
MKYTQILHGERQTGKTDWLVEQAVKFIENRKASEYVIVVAAPKIPMAQELVSRIRSRRNQPTINIVTSENVDSLRGKGLDIKEVLVLVDELGFPKSEEHAGNILAALESALITSTPVIRSYATQTIGNE